MNGYVSLNAHAIFTGNKPYKNNLLRICADAAPSVKEVPSIIMGIENTNSFNGILSASIPPGTNRMYIWLALFYAWAQSATANVVIDNIFLFKYDNWQIWLTKAGLNPSSYTSLDEIVNNASVMSKLSNDMAATNYMMRCTGTIMGSVLGNDIAFDAILPTTKQKMAANPHWSKFAAIYDRIL